MGEQQVNRLAPDYSATIDRFSGYADIYNSSRPAPPDLLGELLPRLAGTVRPQRVVDLGCGTGLSTRFWQGKADQIIGIDPSPDMLAQARASTQADEITFSSGFGHQTGLSATCTDIVTCCQSLHWMEPDATFAEVARILRLGGVFAANDYEMAPILPVWEASQAYQEFLRKSTSLDHSHDHSTKVPRWHKSEHLERMQSSGRFRYVQEFHVHHVDRGNADRLVGLALSMGYVESLLKAGVSETELGLDVLRREAKRLLGDETQPWWWTSTVRVGIV